MLRPCVLVPLRTPCVPPPLPRTQGRWGGGRGGDPIPIIHQRIHMGEWVGAAWLAGATQGRRGCPALPAPCWSLPGLRLPPKDAAVGTSRGVVDAALPSRCPIHGQASSCRLGTGCTYLYWEDWESVRRWSIATWMLRRGRCSLPPPGPVLPFPSQGAERASSAFGGGTRLPVLTGANEAPWQPGLRQRDKSTC